MSVRKNSIRRLVGFNLLAAALAVGLAAGCKAPTTNGNDNASNSNTNANGNSNANTNDNASNSNQNSNDNGAIPTNGELTESQKAAVNAVEQSYLVLPGAITGVASLDLVRDPQQVPDEHSTFFNCPEVTLDRNGGVYTITLDFGDACTNGAWGDIEYSGTATGSYATSTKTFTLEYDGFSVDGETLDGTVELSFDFGSNGGGWTLTLDLTDGDGDTAVGTLAAQFSTSNGIITITDANLTLTQDGVTYSVVGEGLVINPREFGNFVPSAGTFTFDVPNETPPPDTFHVVVTFDESSPVDGTVDVSINGGPGQEHTLADF